MRFRPAPSSTTGIAPAPFQSSQTSPSPRKKGRKFPLKVLSPNNATPPRRSAGANAASSSKPSAKRRKSEAPVVQQVDYPDSVNVPSRATIKALYECAVENPDSHQARHLEGTGLLSLEDVLIPAMMQQEVEALKQVQAKAQRDGPQEAVSALVACRRALYETAHAGMQAARETRQVRQEKQAQREAMRAEERRVAREQAQKEQEEARLRRREERSRLKAEEMERHKRDLRKKLPRNVKLWREYALLMAELAKLQKEERLWKETDQSLLRREKELEREEEEKQAKESQEGDEEASAENQQHELQIRSEQTVQDITISSLRVEQAVRRVADLVAETDDVGEALYSKYRSDHQFHGYRGVKNPKALIRAFATDG